jgi:hypothetical protein
VKSHPKSPLDVIPQAEIKGELSRNMEIVLKIKPPIAGPLIRVLADVKISASVVLDGAKHELR